MRTVLAALLVAAAPAAALAAPPTLDQSLGLMSVRTPRISPDGARVVYERQETDWKENAYVTQLFLADARGGKPLQLTRGTKSSSNAEWSPDGRWIAFLTERETAPPKAAREPKDPKASAEAKPEARQIWIISPAGGEAWPLTAHGSRIDTFHWSRDGRTIAFTAPVPDGSAVKDRKDLYGDYEVVGSDYDQSQLWTVEVAEAERSGAAARAVALTSDRSRSVGEFDWSPDSGRIAFAATPNPLIANRSDSDVYVVERARPESVRAVVTLPGPDDAPLFSPDGAELAFETALGEPYHYYANTHVATVRLADVATRPARAAADVRDRTGSLDEDASLLAWGPDGILLTALRRTDAHLFRIPAAGGAMVRVSGPDRLALSGVSLSRDFKTAAFTLASETQLPEVAVSALDPFRPRILTDMTSQTAGWTLGPVSLVRWKSSDGAEIEGVLHKPADFQPGQRRPLLVVIHGGPTGISRALMAPGNRYYPIEIFLSKGALVLEPNYRGSAGYGGAFRALNVRNLGVGDMADVMSGVDALVAQGLADPDRLGVMGWSQGGYISAFLATNTDRFKAISVGAGISDWTTYYVNTDITPFTRQYLHATPWDDPQIYATTSPITNVRKAKTPTLIQHGENDKRVPIPNAYQLYRGLRDASVPARMIVYAGFGHGITKPRSNRAVLQHNLDWFSHYVWGEPLPAQSPLHGRGEVLD